MVQQSIKYHSKSLWSSYKNLVVSGCSFTHNEHESHVTWGNTLAYWAGQDISNHAVNGAGSSHIANSVVLHLEKNKPSPDNTLIIVMWSLPGRVDWITDRSVPKHYNNNKHIYYYDDFNELSPLLVHRSAVGDFFKTAHDYRKYQSDHSYCLQYWLDVQSLTNYLKVHNYRYLYTSIYELQQLQEQLATIGLSFDRENWLPLNYDDYLGAWARKKNMTAQDQWHPTAECQELWTQDILVPILRQQQIIHDSIQI